MRGLKSIISACTLVFAANANAGYIVDEYDWYTPSIGDNGIYLSADGVSSYSWTHNIVDDGFRPGKDVIKWAELTINVRDDSRISALDGQEFGLIFGDAQQFDGNVSSGAYAGAFEFDTEKYNFNLTGFWQLSVDGILDVSLEMLSGDIILKDSKLEAKVPESTSIALLAIGLIGLGLARRRSQK